MRFFARLRHVRLTTAIAALMLVSIAVTIAAYSVSTYLSLRGQALDQAVAQQSADLKTAATIYERRLNGSVLTWSEEDGSIVSFTTYSIPFFYDTAGIEVPLAQVADTYGAKKSLVKERVEVLAEAFNQLAGQPR